MSETINLKETSGLSESGPQHFPVGDSSVESSPLKFETNCEIDACGPSRSEEDEAKLDALAKKMQALLTSDSLSEEDKERLRATVAQVHIQKGEPNQTALPKVDFSAITALRADYDESHKTTRQALDALQPFENRTDSFIAQGVIKWFGEGIVNCSGIGTLTYNGRYWQSEVSGVLRHYVEKVLTHLAGHVASNRVEFHQWLRKCWSPNGMKAIIEEVKAQAKLISIHDLDSDPLLLNVANGTLNLATGKLQPHDPNDLITRVSPVAYDGNAICSLFEEAILKICNNDPELMRYVQKVLGYVLTGFTFEQAMFLFVGNGANGKSLLLELIQKILGSYHQHIPASTFLRGSRNASSQALTALHGTRMTTLSEFNRGERWNEALLKSATGDTHLTGTFPQKQEITFTPQFKLFMVSNFKPLFDETEHGLWRRFRLIECRNRFWDAGQGETGPPDLQADKCLAQKLEGELSGILNWVIRGYCAWQNTGLGSPPRVQKDNLEYRLQKDNLEYRLQNDSLSQFLEDEVEFSPSCRVPKSDFFDKYTEWAKENGFTVLAKNDFGTQLKERSIKETKSGATRFWQGLNLKESEPKEKEAEGIPTA